MLKIVSLRVLDPMIHLRKSWAKNLIFLMKQNPRLNQIFADARIKFHVFYIDSKIKLLLLNKYLMKVTEGWSLEKENEDFPLNYQLLKFQIRRPLFVQIII
jgi:hypothetical protein